MPAVNLAAVLQPALREKYAVAGLVVLGWEDAVAYVEAAEEAGCPLILQAGPGARAHTPVPVIGKMLRHLADRASVPVCVHLDHGKSYDECAEGLDHGFTSLMFDGSALPLGENIETTARLVKTAHRHNVSVEGEVGFVGYAEGAASRATEPREAKRFADESKADALAVSVGNVHLQEEKSDGIDRDALAKIEAATSIPLVLHGGSGIPSEERSWLAANSNVCKFNIGTELRMKFGEALRESISSQPDTFDRIGLLKPVIDPLREMAMQILQDLRNPV